jgi:probable phosphoglycerate mutase
VIPSRHLGAVPTILLIRHGAHDRPGPHLVGRDDSVGLAPEGVREAEALARALQGFALAAVASSPSRRCRDTAARLADAHGLEVEVDDGLDEIDFGEWRGRRFDEIAGPEWLRWNTARGTAAIPGGETIGAVATRANAALARLGARGPLVAAVTHADVIRTAVATAIGLAPDLMLRLEVPTGSLTALDAGTPPRLLALGWQPAPPLPAG